MPPGSIGNKIDVLRRIGPSGLAKTLYYSRRVNAGALGLVLGKKVKVNISPTASVKILNRLFVGSITSGAPKAFGTTKLSIGPEATVQAGAGLPRIGPGSALTVDGEFQIGNSFLNAGVQILCGDRIEIGDGCSISWDVTISDDDRHTIVVDSQQRPQTAPIVIEDGVWIGYGASIKKGVTLGKGSVVASDSTVTKDVPAHALVAGSPAEVLREGVSWEV